MILRIPVKKIYESRLGLSNFIYINLVVHHELEHLVVKELHLWLGKVKQLKEGK